MTDAALLLGVSLSMAACWHVMSAKGLSGRVWGYLFFLGLAVSLLAKGPVGVVLILMPLSIWAVWKRQGKAVLALLPWAGGLLLTAALTLPWYLAAEVRTPGFLEYFFIGEHWLRFTQPDWPGDLYGSAHSQPRGTIWLLWVAAAFPWSLPAIGALMKFIARPRRILPAMRSADRWTAYLIAWAVAPMLFFSLAGNILWTYVLPGMPALALLVSSQRPAGAVTDIGDVRPVNHLKKAGTIAGFSVPLIFGAMVLLWSFFPYKNSQKFLIARYLQEPSQETGRLVYLHHRPYSAEFYSRGKALKVSSLSRIEEMTADRLQDFYAVQKERRHELSPETRARLVELGSYDNFILLREKVEPGHLAARSKGVQSAGGHRGKPQLMDFKEPEITKGGSL